MYVIMKKIQFEAKKLEIFIFFTYMIREGFKKKKNLVCLDAQDGP